jgi:pentatricopeptide repeat protein
MGIQAIEVYRRIPEEFIDEVTYVGILNAYSHSGLVDEARLIFKNIQIKTENLWHHGI